jgi:hypothetical protein
MSSISQRSLTPEEITKVAIDDLMRDRLLKEPELLPLQTTSDDALLR